MKLPTKIDNGGQLPTRSTERAAGLDLYASHDCWLFPLVPTRIRIGVAAALPEGTVGQLWPRSGLGSRGFHVLGGVIDEDYRGFVGVLAVLLRWWPMRVRRGDRIAQLVICKIVYPEPEERPDLPITRRGSQAYGSSGR